MSKVSSEAIPNEVHNSPLFYCTVSHEKNILVKNKGQCINPLCKPLTMHCSPHIFLSPNIKDQRLRLARSLPCCEPKITARVEELKGDVETDGTKESIPFSELTSAVVGNYFEDRLYEIDIKNGYLKASKNNRNYRKTQAYMQAKKMYEHDETRFKKDQVLYKGKQTVILGLENVLARISLEEMSDCDATFEIDQNGFTLGTVLSSLTLGVCQAAAVSSGVS
eukprot:TRINITY_DN3896_c0_g1_i4.p1 TRINITY_DN3896_c0_g1~~TRINITY_DN3896_c0_g1_i4.p1  ORF type:complete len:222 (+),score=33.66 TRINITY_DN3896_c0_g1_i4:229-894(+)